MGSQPAAERRGSPRFSISHTIEGASLGQRRIDFRGTLCDLSEGGCQLHLDTQVPQGSAIQARCDISGIGLELCGEIVWVKATADGVLHGVHVTGFPSAEDGQFQRVYLRRLAVRLATPPQEG